MLALLNPKGRTLWRKEKQTLWGLCFANEYKQPNPLDPQLLFAGQYFDEESGLVYNRFRYYDPESGNYISSDPIGLAGGETPYSYVHNVLDFLDPFGLSSCQLAKAMEKAGISRPVNSAAHHIVPETAKRAELARNILEKHGININSELNGVFLPNAQNTDGLAGIFHNGRHPNEYVDAINKRISEADVINGKLGVLKELNVIRDILQSSPRNASWKTILT